MAITDINISEQLQTDAPSIRYSGTEGPKSPQQQQQEMQIAQQIWEALGPEQQSQFQSFQQFFTSGIWKQVLQQMQADQGPQEDITTEEVTMRSPAAYGGIMDTATGRRGYFLGSIKKALKSVAKPFKKVLKSDAGKAALLYAGTAGLGNLLAPGGGAAWGNILGKGGWMRPSVMAGNWLGKTIPGTGLEWTAQGPVKNMMTKTPGVLGKWGLTKGGGSFMPTKLGALTAASVIPFTGAGMGEEDSLADTAMSGMKDLEFDFDYGEMRKEIARAVQSGDKAVFDAVLDEYNLTEGNQVPFWEDLRTGSAQGGRIGYYAGGQSVPSDYTMEDALMTTTQDKLGGITDVMKQADLFRSGDIGQFYAADGGRIGYQGGGFSEDDLLGVLVKKLMSQGMSPEEAREEAIRIIQGKAQGGRIRAQEGGLMDLGGMEKDYRNDGGFVPIGGEEKADDVPARLSRNEFVFTADAVRAAGGGDIDQGAEVMENVMENLEQGGRISDESQGLAGAQEMFGVSERLSEVV